jgi:hypothetical protein
MYFLTVGSTMVMSYSIFGENFREETEWDSATRGWGTDEASRVFICAAITLVDISILLQVLALPVVCCQHAGRNRPTRAARRIATGAGWL